MLQDFRQNRYIFKTNIQVLIKHRIATLVDITAVGGKVMFHFIKYCLKQLIISSNNLTIYTVEGLKKSKIQVGGCHQHFSSTHIFFIHLIVGNPLQETIEAKNHQCKGLTLSQLRYII